MRSPRSGYSLALALAALVTGCTSGASGDDAQSQQTEALTAPTLGAAEIAALARQPKIERAQLIAWLGDKTPAASGAACATIGAACAPSVNAVVRPCGHFAGVCSPSGNEDIVPLSFFCLPDNTGAGVCTPVATGPQQTIACTVSSDGRACSTGCSDNVCQYTGACDAEADQVKFCASGGTCANNQCGNETVARILTGSCSRSTEGASCFGELPPGITCRSPNAPICAPDETCRCLSGPL